MSANLPVGTSGRSARTVATEACLVAGEILRKRFQGALTVTYRSRGNIVTDADIQAEQAVLALLRTEFPDAGFLAEESSKPSAGEQTRPYLWVVDPLDGTKNFSQGIPFFSVVVALAHQGKVVLGATYDPVREEMFLAEEGKGATLNGKPIHVSRKPTLEESTLGFDTGYNDEKALTAIKLLATLWPRMQTVRVMGSAALGLAYAASGRLDLYFHHALSPWDIAAGLILLPEAGGLFTDRNGKPAGLYADGLIASNAELHRRFLAATEGSSWRTSPPLLPPAKG